MAGWRPLAACPSAPGLEKRTGRTGRSARRGRAQQESWTYHRAAEGVSRELSCLWTVWLGLEWRNTESRDRGGGGGPGRDWCLEPGSGCEQGVRGSRPAAVRGEEQEDGQAAVSDQLPLVEPGRVGGVMGSGVPGFVT